jgi:hypothetical protein
MNLRLVGLSGKCIPTRTHLCQLVISSLRSQTTTTRSANNPSTTNPVNQGSDFSQQPDDFSRVVTVLARTDISLSKAEAEPGKDEAMQIKCGRITVTALLLAVFAKCVIAILALRGGTTTRSIPNL